jgi:hypothetical protein
VERSVGRLSLFAEWRDDSDTRVAARTRPATRPSAFGITLRRRKELLMTYRGIVFIGAMGALLLATGAKPKVEADELRNVERERTRALVEGNMEVAQRLHADDYQLINPMGGVLTKQEYLSAVASGDIDYLEWEPETIEVKLFGNAAVIRYRAPLRIVVKAAPNAPSGRFWFTDLYEKRNGQWQIVWSQATQTQ